MPGITVVVFEHHADRERCRSGPPSSTRELSECGSTPTVLESSADLFGERDKDALRATDRTEPTAVLVLHQLANPSVIALQLMNPTTLTSKNPGGPSAAMHECPLTAGMTSGVGKGMFSV